MKQKAIGGYFSLELPYNEYGEYHRDAIRLNSGRYCLEYVLRVKKYTKVYLPYYMCDAVLQPINKLGLDYQFYHIDKYFHIAEVLHPKKDEVILYCNYFGLMDEYVKIVTDRYAPNIIIDNTQAFLANPFLKLIPFILVESSLALPMELIFILIKRLILIFRKIIHLQECYSC